jgi:hypothetical protein
LGSEATVELVLGGGHAVTGTAVGDGAPLVGAHVVIGRAHGNLSDLQFVGVTDAGGGFRIDGLAKGTHQIGILADGYGHRSVNVNVPQRKPVSLELLGERELQGRVVDSDGRGVVGAEIVVTPVRNSDREGLWGRRTVSLAEGRFRLRGLRPEPHRLVVHPGNAGESFLPLHGVDVGVPGDEEMRIEVERARVIEGVAIDAEGLPALGLQIRAFGSDSPDSAAAWPDERGRFRLTGLRVSSYLVVALRENSTVAHGGRVAVGSRDLRLLVESAATISGVLSEQDGEPAGGRRILAIPHGSARATFQSVPPTAEAKTAPDGRFSVGPVPRGRYRLCVDDPRDSSIRVAVGTDAGVESGATGVGLRVPQFHTLVLVVLNDAGEPVGHRGLRLRQVATGRWFNVDRNRATETEVSDLLAGRYEVSGWIADETGRPRLREFGTVLGEAGRVELRPE